MISYLLIPLLFSIYFKILEKAFQKYSTRLLSLLFFLEDFFIYLMSGYTDFLFNSKFFSFNMKEKNNGDNIRFKSVDEDFIKEIFNLSEFIAHSKDELFYIAFSKTKINLVLIKIKQELKIMKKKI